MATRIGRRLREERLRLSKTQVEMAAAIGVSPRTYQRYETGVRTLTAPELRTLRGLGVSIDRLLLGDQPPIDSGSSDARPARAIDVDLLAQVLHAIHDHEQASGRKISPSGAGWAATILYIDGLRNGRFDREFADRLLGLVQ